MARSTLLLALVVLATWSRGALEGGFVLDDREAILDNPLVSGALPLGEAFGRDFWHHRGDAGHYRPVATLALRADRALYGVDPRGFHLTNALLQAAVACVLFFVLVRLGTPPPAAWWGVLVVAVHPALADSVAWVSGRTSMLAALGGLLATAVLVAARPAASRLTSGALVLLCALLLACALGAKEEAVVFLALFALLGAVSRGRRRALAFAAALLAGVAWLALRGYALGSPWPTAPRAPLAALSLGERLFYGGRVLLEGLRLALLPIAHPPSYHRAPGFHPGDPPPAAALLGWALWGLFLVLGARCALDARRERGARVAAAGCVRAAVGVLPLLQLVPAGEVFAPRFLYVPLLFAAPAVGLVLLRVPAPLRLLATAVLAGGAWTASAPYTDLERYARATLACVPGDPAAWNTLGIALEEKDREDEAAAAWRRALELDPGQARAWNNLGRLELARGEGEAAERAFRTAVARGPANPVARCNLASLLLRRGEAEEAARLYGRATELAPGFLPAWRGRGNALTRLGRWSEGAAALERARRLDPSDERTLALLGRLARRRGLLGAGSGER